MGVKFTSALEPSLHAVRYARGTGVLHVKIEAMCLFVASMEMSIHQWLLRVFECVCVCNCGLFFKHVDLFNKQCVDP